MRQVASSTLSSVPPGIAPALFTRMSMSGISPSPAGRHSCCRRGRPRPYRRARSISARSRISPAASVSARARHDDHVAALGGEDFRGGAADALRAAGDQRGLACKLQVHERLLGEAAGRELCGRGRGRSNRPCALSAQPPRSCGECPRDGRLARESRSRAPPPRRRPGRARLSASRCRSRASPDGPRRAHAAAISSGVTRSGCATK